MRAPRLCRCGHRVAHGVACPCERREDAARKARFDKGRSSASARGYDADWRAARDAYLAEHPACEWPGCCEKAAEVDHRIPIRKAPHLRLDPRNFQSLCTSHHRRAKQALDRRTYGRN